MAKKDKLPEQEYSHQNGFLLWHAANLWQRSVRSNLDPLGITHVQYLLMLGLQELSAQQEEGQMINQSALATHTKTDKMMTSKVVRSLEEKYLVERLPVKSDSRAFAISLTRRGNDLLEKAKPLVTAAEDAVFDSLGKKREKLFRHLNRMLSKQPEDMD